MIAMISTLLIQPSFSIVKQQTPQVKPQSSPRQLHQYIYTVILRYYGFAVKINAQTGHSECPWALPTCSMDVYLDTNNHIWTIKWDSAGYVAVPLPAVCCACSVGAQDGKGFTKELMPAKHSGIMTMNYNNTGTWTSSQVNWVFTAGEYFICFNLTVNLFAGGSPEEGCGFGGSLDCVEV